MFDSRHRPRHRPLLALAVSATVAIGLTAAGCSDAHGDAQPAPGISSFAPGNFDQLPHYRGSAAAGARSEKDGVVTRSYLVEHTSPALILDFYEQEMTGWHALGKVREGPDALHEDFRRDDGSRLRVSAETLSRGGTDMAPSVQYSLELHTA